MKIITGKIQSAQKVVIYGPEGIGKSTFASKFPNPLFIDTEGSTKHLDVARTQPPTSWTMLFSLVKSFKDNPMGYQTLVIDTADWAERLCTEHICSKKENIAGIEDFGYGKGYTYLAEEFGRLLNSLEDIIDNGINIVITAHAFMRKFEQPDEIGAYDRWELKLQKKTAPLLKEWADMVLFANYKTYVVNVDNQGAAKGKNKAQGGKRVMYTTHHSCWDAKNRIGLPDELDFDYKEIAQYIPTCSTEKEVTVKPVDTEVEKTLYTPLPDVPFGEVDKLISEVKSEDKTLESNPQIDRNGLPPALADLMEISEVTEDEVRAAVAKRGYYPEDTPIQKYDQGFIDGVLIAAWAQVFNIIKEMRDAV